MVSGFWEALGISVSNRLTAIAYHYVRDLNDEEFPDVKGLSIGAFRGQVEYLRQHYNLIAPHQVVELLSGNGADLPPRAALLTFDDGLSDHYRNVFPVLREYGVAGAFFPPVRSVMERQLLDVHKAHFVLARTREKAQIMEALCDIVNELRLDYKLDNVDTYIARWSAVGRYGDAPPVIFVKRMLQKGLPEGVRPLVANKLFAHFVCRDQGVFAEELYLSLQQLQEMADAGMYIGGHGYSHRWLETLEQAEQLFEIQKMQQFMGAFHADAPWLMTYPHGSCNEALKSLLAEHGCVGAFTVEIGIADVNKCNAFMLPRLDTNHLPMVPGEANEWTSRIL